MGRVEIERVRELKAAMVRAGIRQKDIAAKLQVTTSHVNKVVSGVSKSARVMQALRDAGIPESVLLVEEKAA